MFNKVLDVLTALVLSIVALALFAIGFVGTFAAAISFPPNSMSQLAWVVVALAVMWSCVLPMRAIQKMDI